MWFYISVPPSAKAVDLAVVDTIRGIVVLPIIGTWKWSKGKQVIPFRSPNLFKDVYRDAIQILFGSKPVALKYRMKILKRISERERAEEFERNLEDLKRYRQIVEK